MMKDKIRDRLLLAAQFTILLAQIAGIAFASIQLAQADSGMTISATRPVTHDGTAEYRNEIQARARVAVWQTRFNAMSNLGLKLNNEQPSSVRLAGNFESNSG